MAKTKTKNPLSMLRNIYLGKFIVFDGLDGSGQSTQLGLLRDFLIQKGFQVVTTKEPTPFSEAGKKIRLVLEKKIKANPKELQELFAEDRKEHLDNTVIPALKEGKYVISDRYFFSSFAYGAADGLDLDWLIKINDNFLQPDLNFFLKVKAETCIARIEKRGTEKTLFEKTERLARVWGKYELLPSRFENIVIIDGEKPINEVFEDVKKEVSAQLLK